MSNEVDPNLRCILRWKYQNETVAELEEWKWVAGRHYSLLGSKNCCSCRKGVVGNLQLLASASCCKRDERRDYRMNC